MSFDFEIDNQKDYATLKLKGKLIQLEHTDNLKNSIDPLLENGQANYLLDMDELDYINSSGLNSLVSILTKSRNKGGETVIINVSDKIKELFLITKLNTVFSVEDNLEAAIRHFNQTVGEK